MRFLSNQTKSKTSATTENGAKIDTPLDVCQIRSWIKNKGLSHFFGIFFFVIFFGIFFRNLFRNFFFGIFFGIFFRNLFRNFFFIIFFGICFGIFFLEFFSGICFGIFFSEFFSEFFFSIFSEFFSEFFFSIFSEFFFRIFSENLPRPFLNNSDQGGEEKRNAQNWQTSHDFWRRKIRNCFRTFWGRHKRAKKYS